MSRNRVITQEETAGNWAGLVVLLLVAIGLVNRYFCA